METYNKAIKEAIILAGGLGTRLRDTVPDLPKCMAPVADLPFITYVIRHLLSSGIEKFVFSLGYKHEKIESFLLSRFPSLQYKCVIEKEPLGTGGAIQLALKECENDHVVVTNGDTMYRAPVEKLFAHHLSNEAHCTLALKPMKNFDRYGVVETNSKGRVIRFAEKKQYAAGNINGGMYIINKKKLLKQNLPEKFSFEKDYLETFFSKGKIYGLIMDDYFIDIGIPEDYSRAQNELIPSAPDMGIIDRSWSLFLDRDGVINYDKDGSYIFNTAEFIMYDGVPEAIKKINDIFGHVFIVTNQRGVGKQLMTEADLAAIHQKMTAAFTRAGAKIDQIYYCTSLDDKHPERKPNPGMALLAKKDFSMIDLSKSIIAGNKMSDMQFGRNAGMKTVYIASTHPEIPFPHPDIDMRFDLLTDFAKAL